MPSKGNLVMIVDDDQRVGKLYVRVLESHGFSCRYYIDPEDALDALTDDIDYVVTDMIMRGMDGVSFATEVRRRRPELPILMTTAYATNGICAQLRQLDVDLLLKPVSPKDLLTWFHSATSECL
jgi:DNA-binding NtrC family response regulator